MALRLFLVSMVAGMGLSLPTARDLESWNSQAHAYWMAGIEQWDALMPSGVRAFAEDARPAPQIVVAGPRIEPIEASIAEPDDTPLIADIQFEAIVEVMASRFSNDLAPLTTLVAEAPPALPTTAAVELLELPTDVFASDEPTTEVATARPANLDGLGNAVRLTKEALTAWASVLGRPTAVISLRQ